MFGRWTRTAGEHVCEVAASEAPLKGARDLLIVSLKSEDATRGCQQRGKVGGRERLSLENGEVDLDLVQPARVDGEVDENEIRPPRLEPGRGSGSAMNRSVVDNPEDAARGPVWGAAHHIRDEGVERVIRDGGNDMAEERGAMHVPRGEIRTGAVALIG